MYRETSANEWTAAIRLTHEPAAACAARDPGSGLSGHDPLADIAVLDYEPAFLARRRSNQRAIRVAVM